MTTSVVIAVASAAVATMRIASIATVPLAFAIACALASSEARIIDYKHFSIIISSLQIVQHALELINVFLGDFHFCSPFLVVNA